MFCQLPNSPSLLQILDTLAEIQERHAAVEQLEKSLWELRQVFLDMAVLVESQGAMLDSIEAQVSACVIACGNCECSVFATVSLTTWGGACWLFCGMAGRKVGGVRCQGDGAAGAGTRLAAKLSKMDVCVAGVSHHSCRHHHRLHMHDGSVRDMMDYPAASERLDGH
jgi:hypothetical protein